MRPKDLDEVAWTRPEAPSNAVCTLTWLCLGLEYSADITEPLRLLGLEEKQRTLLMLSTHLEGSESGGRPGFDYIQYLLGAGQASTNSKRFSSQR